MKVQIYFLSRDYRLLALLTVVILAIGGWVGVEKSGSDAFDVSEYLSLSSDPLPLLEQALAVAPGTEKEPIDRIGRILGALSSSPKAVAKYGPKVLAALDASSLPAPRKQLYQAYWSSLTSLAGEPDALLLTLAYRQQLAGANYLPAQLYLRQENFDRALLFLKREADFPQSSAAREQEIQIHFVKRNYDALTLLAADPRYKAEWPAIAEVYLSAKENHWFQAAWAMALHEWTQIDPSVVGLVLLSGALWFIISLQAVQVTEAPIPRLSLCVTGVMLGAASVIPTLLLGIWTEERFGLVQGKGFVGDLLFFMVSVGPREELCKFVAFLPLVPFLIRRKHRLEMLIAAGCVGLGFAIEENMQYFAQDISAAFGRFLTANFLHLSTTALLGLSFCEACLDPRKKGWLFVVTFFWISFLHGAYDAFIVIPQLSFIAVGNVLCFIWLSLFFFKNLRRYRSEIVNYFWMPATILLGLSVIVSVTFVKMSMYWDAAEAAQMMSIQGVSLSMILYLLLWQSGNLREEPQAPQAHQGPQASQPAHPATSNG